MRVRRLLLWFALLALTACGGGAEPEAGPATEPTMPATERTAAPEPIGTEPAPSPAPTDTEEDTAGDGGTEEESPPPDEGIDPVGGFGEDTVSGQGASPTDDVALLSDVRAGAHEGFDRVVLEFEADDVPSYRVSYVDPPVTEAGSGREIEIEGSAFLQITVTPAAGVDLSGAEPVETYTGPDRVDAESTAMVTEVVQTGDFEANLTWVAGLHQRMPFAVETFQGPGRLVIDVSVP